MASKKSAPAPEKTKKPAPYKRREYQGLAPMTAELRTIAAPILGKRGFTTCEIIESWSDILGAELSMGVLPEKIVFEKNNRTNGILYVKTAGGAFAMLFDYQQARVIEKINTFFGYPAIAHIKIRQGHLNLPQAKPEKPKKLIPKSQLEALQKKVSLIEDESLRETTYNIGLALLQQK